MLPTSARFLAALRQSHTIADRVRLYRPGAPTAPIEVKVAGGSVRADADARVMRQGALEIAFDLADPVTTDLIRELPFGGYATVERGIRYANGDLELLQLGRFRVENVTWPELQGTATVTLADRMAQVADESFTTPYTPGGQKPTNAIVALVQAVFGATIDYHVTTNPAGEPTLVDVVYDEDRAQAISDLAAGVDAQAYFDNLGDFVLRPKPAEGAPVWTLDGGEAGVLISSDESLDRSSVRNGVAVRAVPDPTLPAIYSLVTDDDPASPTRWGGPFGKVPLIVNSTSIQTQAQADQTARSLLNLRLGLSRTLELRSVPNPALEPGDLLQIDHPDGRAETAIINAVEIGLEPGGDVHLSTRTNWRPQPIGMPTVVRAFTGDAAMVELAEAEAGA
ncbi:MAG TPA: DUF5047 domain-containing protein [Solirubrobacteraceae bacterium]|nr:DUF5047 domain-containing protein [Solirubrobacteraceae bacterium]